MLQLLVCQGTFPSLPPPQGIKGQLMPRLSSKGRLGPLLLEIQPVLPLCSNCTTVWYCAEDYLREVHEGARLALQFPDALPTMLASVLESLKQGLSHISVGELQWTQEAGKERKDRCRISS